MNEPVSVIRRAQRWAYILKSHRPSQLVWRAFFLAQRRLFPLLPQTSYTSAPPFQRRANAGFDAILDRQLAFRGDTSDFADRVDRLLDGEYGFLNEWRRLGPMAATDLQDVEPVSHLWRFHLHYQEYLLDLLAADRNGTHPGAAQRIWPEIDAWIDRAPITRPGVLGDAWHPFCLSRRLPVWLLAWHAGVIPAEGEERFARSLEAQARYLERHLEWDLRGNHLLENLKALLLVGAFGEAELADLRHSRSRRYFVQQLEQQLLPSGEHFERSPMYHVQMLAAVLDVRDATAAIDPQFSEICQRAARQMTEFLEQVLHPDGQIPLLSDSALGETPSPMLLIEAARAPAVAGEINADRGEVGDPIATIASDYWTFRENQSLVLFDRGDVGADDLPAHAHNDLLTLEVSLGGRRLIVDSGVFNYADGPMREYCRSTAAHNVLQIDGQEQCDLWSRFRMGRRGHRRELASGWERDFVWGAATHDAYSSIGVPRIGRWITCRPGGPMIVSDWADGEGSHQLDLRVHLSPDVQVSAATDGALSLTLGEVTAQLSFLSEGQVSLEEGWYCPDFGVRLPSTVIQWSHFCSLPAMVVWSLRWTAATGNVHLDTRDPQNVRIIWEDDDGDMSWSPRLML